MKNQTINASIEARMTSSRLPGKVLMNAINNVSMLEFMINRIKLSKRLDDIVVATTINREDQPIVDLCDRLGVKYYRGSEEDVLQRVLFAHNELNSDIIVELTGDCQLIDYRIIDEVIDEYLENDYDYVSNCHVRSFPIGLDVEVFSRKLLEDISKEALDIEDREHVSLYIYKSGNYSLKAVIADEDLFWPELRITLDDKGDYLFLREIISNFYPKNKFDFSAKEVIEYIKSNIHLLDLLDGVRVKENIYEKKANK